MKKYLLILFFSLFPLLFSCIPNKEITYLQYNNEHQRGTIIEKDSLIRRYNAVEPIYKLKPGDLLDIKISTVTPVTHNPFIDADRFLVPGQTGTTTGTQQGVKTQGYYVDHTGHIEIPIIGRIKVEGLTVNQAEKSVSSYVAEYLPGPVVRIKLLNFRFSVIGEVPRETTIVSEDNYVTLIQALSLAGGTTEYGDLSRVKVIRHIPGETHVFYVNLLAEDFLASPLYYVQPGDVIVVSPLRQRAYFEYTRANLGIFTSSVSLFLAILTLLRL
jgi:polysaccharide biosynthesis/export protein